LSSEEVDKLVQFQDITGIDDLQICRALLESKNWDLEATAREQLNLPQSSQDGQVTIL
jgi:FAS-associated factor 2